MIIFDLDDVLADTQHRRHFVDPYYDQSHKGFVKKRTCDCECPHASDPWIHKETGAKWKSDCKAFYEACDQDKPIKQTINILRTLWVKEGEEIQIWSGRCESVRDKTIEWITSYIFGDFELCPLKMRPIGDKTHDNSLKERWIDEAIHEGKKVDFVFDCDPLCIDMWHRCGIFVFDCNQNDKDF